MFIILVGVCNYVLVICYKNKIILSDDIVCRIIKYTLNKPTTLWWNIKYKMLTFH